MKEEPELWDAPGEMRAINPLSLASFFFAYALATLGSLSAAEAQAPPRVDVKRGALAQSIDSDLSGQVASGFSGAVIMEHNGALVLKAGYGWANRARRIPFTTSTIAQIGSLTKQFTATAIVDLALQGKLGFEDTLGKHIAGIPPRTASITIHQLLTHTAGLPDACGDDFERVSREELVSRCLADLTPSAAPTFAYSNLGYSLLASVAESAMGRPLEEYLADRFFKPLRMTRTGYLFGDAIHDSLAVGEAGGDPQPPIFGADGEVEQVSHTGSDGVFFSAFVWRPVDRFFYYLVTNSGEKAGAEARINGSPGPYPRIS